MSWLRYQITTLLLVWVEESGRKADPSQNTEYGDSLSGEARIALVLAINGECTMKTYSFHITAALSAEKKIGDNFSTHVAGHPSKFFNYKDTKWLFLLCSLLYTFKSSTYPVRCDRKAPTCFGKTHHFQRAAE